MFGVGDHLELGVHLPRHLFDRFVLVARHIGYERQSEEVLRGGGFEVLAKIDRHVEADRAVSIAPRHLGAYGAHDGGDDERCHADAERACQFENLRGGHVVLHERGIGLVAPAGDAVYLGRMRCSGLVALVVLVEAVFRLLVVGAVVFQRDALDAVAFLQVGVEQRLEKAQGSAPVRYDVRDFEVDAVSIVAHAEQDTLRVDVQAEADRQVLALYDGRLGRLFEVVPEHAAAQAHVEAGEDVDRLLERMLQYFGIHLVYEGGRIAEHRLGGAARLRRIEFADVV